MKKIRFIDLFSGCGGLSEAFLGNKNFLPVKIIDNDHKIIIEEKLIGDEENLA